MKYSNIKQHSKKEQKQERNNKRLQKKLDRLAKADGVWSKESIAQSA